MPVKQCLILLLALTTWAHCLRAQAPARDTVSHLTVVASEEYNRGPFYKLLLGRNWRKEWATPVVVPAVSLHTLYGGLTPYQRSGSGESRSLRLRSVQGKEYVLRSVNKYRRALLPALLKNSFYGTLVQDGISMSHPYAAFAMPGMMEAAGLLHTKPVLIYLPPQAALDSFNADYGGNLYLLEERPQGDWSTSPHLGGYKTYLGTLEVQDSLRKTARYRVDAPAFIKARLFDILVADVDRHEGNWRWGLSDSGSFHPVPLDRDQAFFTHNGLLTKLAIFLTRRRWMQSFRKKITRVTTLTNYDTSLDAYFAGGLSREDWRQGAQSLWQALTDSVIARSIAGMPPELTAASGAEIIHKLRKRREGLEAQALRYYKALAKSVDIRGSSEKEYFEVRAAGNGAAVRVYRMDETGRKESVPYYERVFARGETVRLTLYGFGGGDVFDIAPGIRGIRVTTVRD
jgi:hypothetical protein